MRNECLSPLLIVVLVIGGTFAVSGVAAGGYHPSLTTDQSEGVATIAGEDETYRTVQAAINDATAGDTVEVRSGTYREPIIVNESIVLSAPDGATVDGTTSQQNDRGITISGDSEPVVDGFSVQGYDVGVAAQDTAGDWEIREMVIEENEIAGLSASNSTGSWTITNSTIRENYHEGVSAAGSSGDWTIQSSVLERNHDDGINGDYSSGEWTIRETVIRSNGDEGIDVENNTGDWLITNTLVEGNDDDGIDADGLEATGNWTIEDSTFRENGDEGIDTDNAQGDWKIRNTTISENVQGINAVNTSGDWKIHDSTIEKSLRNGLNTRGSSGDWTVDDTIVRNNTIVGVAARNASGEWSIRNTDIENSTVGVFAVASTGDWRITHTSIKNIQLSEFGFSTVNEGIGIDARETRGSWEVSEGRLETIDEYSVDATGAAVRGDATGNWWGNPEPDAVCTGNVTCENSLMEGPSDIGASASAETDTSDDEERAERDEPDAEEIPGFGVSVVLIAVTTFSCGLFYRNRLDGS
ncbi:right-handed parallel beta-helix repeat-containing protein [Natrarchaeobaculum aegyptiacum]|uniref:right-handed parallel beta-helix repeat-containing protein n=1 Tax=Natrarchaeobaculum aegyptiacum TaxID=745377 RepID=UPI000A3D7239|nr:right-handed parallel beta-helix repeat-containing protein [Natrarchaeobaculum aegyptiacum]